MTVRRTRRKCSYCDNNAGREQDCGPCASRKMLRGSAYAWLSARAFAALPDDVRRANFFLEPLHDLQSIRERVQRADAECGNDLPSPAGDVDGTVPITLRIPRNRPRFATEILALRRAPD